MNALNTLAFYYPGSNRRSVADRQLKKQTRVPQQIIEAVLAGSPIVDLVRESTPVFFANGQYRSYCPFHAQYDKKKTLLIDEIDQRFSCDVCEFHGSSIGWLMYHDGLPFQVALIELAKRIDIDVSQWIDEQSLIAARRKQLSLLSDVASFYQSQLTDSSIAKDYLISRGISEDTCERFALGYSPQSSETFDKMFSKHARQLWNLGHLVRRANGDFSARFRDRLMFPICDSSGTTLGFGGRTLGDGTPKYLNSPASPIFNKSQILFGLHEATRPGVPINSMLLVEGYLDVLMLSQSEFPHCVATLGTAPSQHHVRDIFKHTDTLIACFDSDSGGHKAARRLLEIALPCLNDDERLLFALLPAGKDPDSMLRESGESAFESVLDHSARVEEFLHDTLAVNKDLSSIGGKAALAAAAQPMVKSITSRKIQQRAIARIESSIGIPWFNSGV